MQIDVIPTSTPRSLPAGHLGFGKTFTDHILRMDYVNGAWQAARIQPYAPISLDPAAAVLHYGQAIFEGLKAFRCKDGKLRTFRPDRHAARFAGSAERLCMPPLPTDAFIEGIDRLVRLEEKWVPSSPGSSLYIRPTMIATEGFLGVRPAQHYTYFVIACPVDAYYAEGSAPVKIWIEKKQSRAAEGGLGSAKTGGNYAASLQAAEAAKARGYSQVLWLDAREHAWLEEVGTMNLFICIGDTILTPALDGAILPGVTRDSVLRLLREKNFKVEERKVHIQEIRDAHKNGTLREVFGTGTAAVISPVGTLGSEDGTLTIADGKTGPIAKQLYEELTAIQRAETEDRFGWTHLVP